LKTKIERYAGLAVFFASFTVYLLTLAPEITFWDSSELIFGATTLGIPHPPAYPVFCMLGKAFYLFMPFGNAAYRVNLMSAFFGALTCFMVFVVVRGLVPKGPARLPVSMSAALLLAFTGPFWAQSVVTEVYTINSFLLTVLAYFLMRHDREKDVAWLHASAFTFGLAFATHQSALFILPAYILYYALAGGVVRRPERVFVSAFFAMFGYSAMLYVPVRSATHPPINIGAPETLPGLDWVLKLTEYVDTLKAVPAKLAILVGGEGALYGLGAAVFCLAAAWVLRKKPYFLFLLFSAAACYAGIHILNAGNAGAAKWGLLSKFYIPALLFAIPTAAAAVGYAFSMLPDGGDGNGRTAAFAFAAWILICLPAVSLWYNYSQVDNSHNFFAFDFGSNTLKSVMQDGALFAQGDNGIFPLWYLQGQEHYRDDVLVMHTQLLTFDWYMDDILGKIRSKYGAVIEKPRDITRLDRYVPIFNFVLEKCTPTYFDYSAVTILQLNIRGFWPQGLIHLVKSWTPVDLGKIWGYYVLRGAVDDSTNKAFAAEGILGIYSYECGIWAQQAYNNGKPREALEAYDLVKKFGGENYFMDKWATGIKRGVGEP
jgi:Protein O-mannosyl-transferase TMEM260-like